MGGAAGWLGATLSHDLQLWRTLSMSAVMPGHQTLAPARAVMLVTPPLPPCSTSSTSERRLLGTTTRSLYMTTGAWAVRWSLAA